MPFWSKDHSEDRTLDDPKRKFRFKVEFQGINSPQGGALMWYAKTVSKPSFQISSAEHKYLNHTFYYPGSVTWQEVSLTLVDPVNPDMAATLSDIIVAGGYSPPSNALDLVSMSKAKASSALGNVIITQLDSDGKALETWTLWNSFITELKFGDLEYGADDLTELSVTLKYDWARIETRGNSVAVNGRKNNEFFRV